MLLYVVNKLSCVLTYSRGGVKLRITSTVVVFKFDITCVICPILSKPPSLPVWNSCDKMIEIWREDYTCLIDFCLHNLHHQKASILSIYSISTSHVNVTPPPTFFSVCLFLILYCTINKGTAF